MSIIRIFFLCNILGASDCFTLGVMANSDVTPLTWFRKGLTFYELHSETGEIFPCVECKQHLELACGLELHSKINPSCLRHFINDALVDDMPLPM